MAKPKIITFDVRGVAARWHEQYPARSQPDKLKIGAALDALPNAATLDEVDALIGNGSWTHTWCSGCGDGHFREVVRVGQEPDYESATAYLCRKCFREAAELLFTVAEKPSAGDAA